MGLFSRVVATGGDPAQIAAHSAAQDEIALRIELLDSFEDAGLGCFWATDAEGRVTHISAAVLRKLGCEPGDFLGRQLVEIFASDTEAEGGGRARPLSFLVGARGTISALPVRLIGTRHETWWEISGKAQLDAKGRFQGYRGSAKDVTQVRERQIAAETMARCDSLTGLANRHHMEGLLARTLDAYRNARRSCALMLLDLDRFKQVNDTLGHPAGDELLKQVAGRLATVVGKEGTIGRLGGDEFLVMLPDMDDRGELGELAQRIIQMVSQPYSLGGSRAIIGTSIGIATAPYDGIDAEALTSAADLALYAAKGGGRGHYRFFASDLKDGAQMRRRIEEDLRDALGSGQLEMHYQPIVASATNRATCMEALLRWQHPDRGFVAPSIFVPVAEEMGLIREVGAFVLQRSCEDAARWPQPLRVAVNVSATQFARDDFPAQVAQVLKATGLDPARLELEITESVFVGDTDRTQRLFEELKALGVRLALDDFGTGYSSLSYLQRAPFDKIKIDRSFVRGATDKGNNNAEILSAIVSLAEALKMETVAEGVETLDELTLVRERGASHVQGYIFAPALTQEAVLERLSSDTEFEAQGPARFRAERRTLFRRIGVIHDNYRYNAVLRNLSKSGAMVDGLLNVPVGTDLVLDLGGGQLAVCVVRRSRGASIGVEFETSLVSDGADGLCTRHRVSPYAIQAAGRPLAPLSMDAYQLLAGTSVAKPSFAEVAATDARIGDPRTGYEYRYR
ncbi:putative bifunctional diguanylate cyclase/phosphodiesterase [Qipengyuania sediminis]|uniref:putative bifunctional diguanylate cyclase/phosphodiesterase n=1 Tax=Qipengyuania sediminis TaxID=1532023 RepID=UPI00105A43E6|nr:EAL domain-containing protein [Qipengyuania sediminis]